MGRLRSRDIWTRKRGTPAAVGRRKGRHVGWKNN